jgi:hypothetical protein
LMNFISLLNNKKGVRLYLQPQEVCVCIDSVYMCVFASYVYQVHE